MIKRRSIQLLVLMAAAVATPAAAQSYAVDSAAIARAGRAFSAAYVANDTAAIGRLYTDSATLLPPGGEVRGRTAIQRAFAWGGNYTQVAHKLEMTALTIEGDMAVDVGTWTSTSRRGEAEPVTISDRYLVVWIRESDGQWRMLYDMWHRPGR